MAKIEGIISRIHVEQGERYSEPYLILMLVDKPDIITGYISTKTVEEINKLKLTSVGDKVEFTIESGFRYHLYEFVNHSLNEMLQSGK